MHQNKLDYKDYNHPKQVSKQVCNFPYVRENQKAILFPLWFTASR